MRANRAKELENRVEELIQGFDGFLEVFLQEPPFKKEGQLDYHVKTIQMLNKLGGAESALKSPDFMSLLWRTLQAWGIGSRSSRIVSLPEFINAFLPWHDRIINLERVQLDQVQDTEEVLADLWQLIQGLAIVSNDTRMVPCTKALHHLLPNLVVPMDRKYTQAFLLRYNPEFQYGQKSIYSMAFHIFVKIAQEANPRSFVGHGWNTSPTKVIDNGIVGYCIAKGIQGEKVR